MSAVRFSNFSAPNVQNYHSNRNGSFKISRISRFSGVAVRVQNYHSNRNGSLKISRISCFSGVAVRVGVVGLATAFAARNILGDVFSGLSLPFSIGDAIKDGSIEGQVVDIGLTYTSLLSPENFRVIVPNSLFSSQVIVYKPGADYHAITTKIPLRAKDLSKISHISNDIKGMLRSNAKVFLGKDVPRCFLSRITRKYAELTLEYNLKNMRKDELGSAQGDILLQAIQIIENHGGAIGSTRNDTI